MTVYLLHFREPIVQANGREVQHYLGHAKDLERRIRSHRLGTSRARLPEVMFLRGITFEVARTWPGGKAREKQIKRQGAGKRKCPICHPGMRLHPEPYQRRSLPLPA